ncbi:unnamed protein product [Diabrotica balteata]|uniref:Uncharacterized protein n=1 Tax=Diabrotica balteata TaxID=107213 RepID=A0A9N9T3C0_DIABA|nr:unnamed protein product [Diabrotica balteata]
MCANSVSRSAAILKSWRNDLTFPNHFNIAVSETNSTLILSQNQLQAPRFTTSSLSVSIIRLGTTKIVQCQAFDKSYFPRSSSSSYVNSSIDSDDEIITTPYEQVPSDNNEQSAENSDCDEWCDLEEDVDGDDFVVRKNTLVGIEPHVVRNQ